jgi:hypothetical protein
LKQRILRTLVRAPRNLMKRDEPVFTRLAVVKGSLRLATYQHVRPPSCPICFDSPSCEIHCLSFSW